MNGQKETVVYFTNEKKRGKRKKKHQQQTNLGLKQFFTEKIQFAKNETEV